MELGLTFLGLANLAVVVQGTSFCAQEGFEQVWSDDFNGSELDASKWTVSLGDSHRSYTRDSWGTEDNVYILNGSLVLRSQKNNSYPGFNYSSGAVDSQNKAFWDSMTRTRVCIR